VFFQKRFNAVAASENKMTPDFYPIGLLQPTPPYRFDLYLAVLRRFQAPSLLQVFDNAVWRVVQHSGGLALLRIAADKDNVLRVDCMAQSGTLLPAELLASAARLCGTDISLSSFYAFAQNQPRLYPLLEPLLGLPIFRSESLFEALLFMDFRIRDDRYRIAE
jgi:hypothetical protein